MLDFDNSRFNYSREIKTGKGRLPENIDTAVDKWLLHNRRHTDATQKYYESVISTGLADMMTAELKQVVVDSIKLSSFLLV